MPALEHFELDTKFLKSDSDFLWGHVFLWLRRMPVLEDLLLTSTPGRPSDEDQEPRGTPLVVHLPRLGYLRMRGSSKHVGGLLRLLSHPAQRVDLRLYPPSLATHMYSVKLDNDVSDVLKWGALG